MCIPGCEVLRASAESDCLPHLHWLLRTYDLSLVLSRLVQDLRDRLLDHFLTTSFAWTLYCRGAAMAEPSGPDCKLEATDTEREAKPEPAAANGEQGGAGNAEREQSSSGSDSEPQRGRARMASQDDSEYAPSGDPGSRSEGDDDDYDQDARKFVRVRRGFVRLV